MSLFLVLDRKDSMWSFALAMAYLVGGEYYICRSIVIVAIQT